MLLVLTLLTLCLTWNYCACSGYFEIQIISMENIRGEISDGTCCDLRGGLHVNRTCPGECDTQFKICLKQYQDQVTYSGQCTFGNQTTIVLGGNTFKYALNDTSTTVRLQFHFFWTRAYTIIVAAWDRGYGKEGDRLIEASAHSGIILPGPSWHTLTHNGPTATMVYRIRVICGTYYYNTTCSKFCRPRNDRLGHYTCNDNGDKVCMPGWLGSDCDIAICRTGCHALHGYCDIPGECRCRSGWQGPLCDQCNPYPGCKHGTCKNSPWTCDCDLNWGGILCDKDLNTCRHRPCVNNGLCINNEPNDYTCECPRGYTGRNCEIVQDPCSTKPCGNGGMCIHVTSGFVCTCQPGWTGDTCHQEINECESRPCLHGGTCVDAVNRFQCLCTAGWQGPQCQLDTNECEGRPCVHAHSCRDLLGDYICECQLGWTGKNCDENIRDCLGQCQNGGTCMDLIGDYYCSCSPGYEGKNCEHETRECDSNPCHHSSVCIDHVAGYTCQCTEGYSGFNCQIDIDPCRPNPCFNGATCYTIDEDYFCYCPEVYTGRDCSMKKLMVAQNVDSCTLSIPSAGEIGEMGGIQLISSGICGKHGLCISRPGGRFECSCSPGFTGEFCHQNINDCASSPCHNNGTCVDLINSYQCICTDDWEGALCNINKDACDPNPCRNHGNCIDQQSGYMCQCSNGWKGKSCTLKYSQCDSSTCANGGTCVDLGEMFTCKCPVGWHGKTCHLADKRACDSGPCSNNATCVNSGDSFTCICPLGFEGRTCQTNVNECNPFPCYNGGSCVDRINRYQCVCPQGFSGPDCRVNINECRSSPCTYGSTCIDGIGEYTCLCPPGRSGKQCEEVKGRVPAAQRCIFNRRTFNSGATWKHECQLCTCDDGDITCVDENCGIETCANIPNVTSHVTSCPDGQTCVVLTEMTCFTPPCLPVGTCQPNNLPQADLSSRLEFCYHGDNELDSCCAKVSLTFDKTKVPIGISVESICFSIRTIMLYAHDVINSTLSVSCQQHHLNLNVVDITLSTGHPPRTDSSELLRTVIKEIVDTISERRSDAPALAAVTDITVETSSRDHDSDKDPVYLIPLVCSLIILLGCIAIALLVAYHKRRMNDVRRWHRASDLSGERTNNENLENFQNLKRFKNPLYEKDKMVGNRNVRQLEGVGRYEELENDTVDRSPTRLLRQDDFVPHGENEWTETVHSKMKVKDINIELNKSRQGRPRCHGYDQARFRHIELDENEVIV